MNVSFTSICSEMKKKVLLNMTCYYYIWKKSDRATFAYCFYVFSIFKVWYLRKLLSRIKKNHKIISFAANSISTNEIEINLHIVFFLPIAKEMKCKTWSLYFCFQPLIPYSGKNKRGFRQKKPREKFKNYISVLTHCINCFCLSDICGILWKDSLYKLAKII